MVYKKCIIKNKNKTEMIKKCCKKRKKKKDCQLTI